MPISSKPNPKMDKLMQIWMSKNVSDSFQVIVLKYMDRFKSQRLNEIIETEIQEHLLGDSSYYKLENYIGQRKIVINRLKSTIAQLQYEQDEEPNLETVSDSLDSVRKNYLIICEQFTRLLNKYEYDFEHFSSNISSSNYFQMFRDFSIDLHFLKDSILRFYISFKDGQDPFLLHHFKTAKALYRNQILVINEDIQELFNVNISYYYRLLRAQQQTIKFIGHAAELKLAYIRIPSYQYRVKTEQITHKIYGKGKNGHQPDQDSSTIELDHKSIKKTLKYEQQLSTIEQENHKLAKQKRSRNSFNEIGIGTEDKESSPVQKLFDVVKDHYKIKLPNIRYDNLTAIQVNQNNSSSKNIKINKTNHHPVQILKTLKKTNAQIKHKYVKPLIFDRLKTKVTDNFKAKRISLQNNDSCFCRRRYQQKKATQSLSQKKQEILERINKKYKTQTNLQNKNFSGVTTHPRKDMRQ